VQFTAEHEALRASVRDLVEREINPRVDEWERAGRFPAHELFPVLAKIGLLGLEYDPAYGGEGADHSFTVVAGEELGRIDCGGVPMGIAVQMAMATPSLHRYGCHELKERFLAPAIRGEMVCSIAVTEPDAGSDVAALRTRAVPDGSDWVINGSKLYITNGAQADWICLLARTSGEGGYRGMSQIVVETDRPGFRVSRTLDKLGKIGRGFQQQMEQFQAERMIAAYLQVGAMQKALDRTREYLARRRVFGRPLLANDHVAYRLAELSAQLDLVRHYNYACADAYLRGEDTSRFATIAKLAVGRLAREIADTCLQFHGGLGYMEETWTARFYRDSRLIGIGGGADEVMLSVLARLDGFTA
jgi:citronellyl-CoA dehydrogenase